MSNNYHLQSVENTFQALKTSLEGLSEDEARLRYLSHGPNILPKKGDLPWWVILFHQFNNPLIYILLTASLLKFFLKGPLDAFVILLVIVIMAGLGFFQEFRAQKAMAALTNLITPKAKVRRLGQIKLISYQTLVPGDIVLLDAGDKVPADLRIIEASHLTAAESALTGESLPIEKVSETLDSEARLTERKNMLYMGTVISSGRGAGVVTAVGPQTEIGKIAASIAEAKPDKTPLQRSVDALSVLMIKIVFVAIVIIFVIGWLRHIHWIELLILSIAAAISAIPEGLPAAVTVVLAIGMQSMAKRHAVIRKLMAVETLGATTVICSDKTGTLTLNQMTVQQIYFDGRIYDVAKDALATEDGNQLTTVFQIGLLCNDAMLLEDKGSVTVSGDPTEGALLSIGLKAGLVKKNLEKKYPRLGDIPFNSERKWMATLHNENGKRVAYLKGALEKLIELASYVHTAHGIEPISQRHKNEFLKIQKDMGSQALRVLGVAYADYPVSCGKLKEECLRGRTVLCGLFGMMDPPRPEVVEAVRQCKTAGVRVVMITGDNAVTAGAIGKRINLETSGVLSGAEMAALADKDLKEKIRTVSIFARIDPLEKLRIVKALQDQGEIVAMTGDGVNDAPALEKADIGIAMGITGTEVAKEAGDMVLNDDNFASIISAVEEGRAIFSRLRNVTAFLMTTCLGELFALILCLMFTGIAPLEPIQILWINVVTGALISIPLGMEPKTGKELSWPPRKKGSGLIYPGMFYRICLLSGLLALSAFLIFQWCLRSMPITEARTVIFSAIVVFEWLLAFSFRSDNETTFSLGLFKNRWLLLSIGIGFLLQLIVNYVGGIHEWFHVVPMAPYEWSLAIIPGLIVFMMETLRKMFKPNLFDKGKW